MQSGGGSVCCLHEKEIEVKIFTQFFFVIISEKIALCQRFYLDLMPFDKIHC